VLVRVHQARRGTSTWKHSSIIASLSHILPRLLPVNSSPVSFLSPHTGPVDIYLVSSQDESESEGEREGTDGGDADAGGDGFLHLSPRSDCGSVLNLDVSGALGEQRRNGEGDIGLLRCLGLSVNLLCCAITCDVSLRRAWRVTEGPDSVTTTTMMLEKRFDCTLWLDPSNCCGTHMHRRARTHTNTHTKHTLQLRTYEEPLAVSNILLCQSEV
jgi:hypothetical protein